MGHYAKVINGKVTKVIVATADYISNYNDEEPELIDYPSSWVKTSYNTRGGVHYQPNSNIPSEDQSKALRGNYAGVGFTYDSTLDVFYAPQPYNSWTLDTGSYQWEPPIPKPDDCSACEWSESELNWVTGSI